MINNNSLYYDLSFGIAEYLKNHQISVEDKFIDFKNNKSANLRLFLSPISNKKINLKIIRLKDDHVSISADRSTVRIKIDQFFKIGLDGRLYTIKNFMGLEENHKGILKKTDSHSKNKPERNKLCISLSIIKKQIKQSSFLYKLLKKVLNRTYAELSSFEGVCFQIKRDLNGKLFLHCYDRGGIFDYHLNAEGITYPPQVPGNYYADAYSVLLFLKIYEQTLDKKWYNAALLSWEFVHRVYPRYKPSHIVWHHSDFKNPAILEVVHQYIDKYPDFKLDLKALYEDYYEPTNVFALRYHWKSLANYLSFGLISGADISEDLQKLVDDQTLDGLFHDNVCTYPDAHDLTYHQYSTACLGQGLLYSKDELARKAFLKAVTFSLAFLGPDGEPAYVGRTSNNLHQSASAILAFHIAASIADNHYEKHQFLRGAKLTAKRIKRFQLDDGMVPTGLNEYVEKRMAWSHCKTPYNALTGYFLLRALEIQTLTEPENNTFVPLEKTYNLLANDAGYACISNGNEYLVIFSGCAKSYGWSEGRHVTGCAGVALYGKIGEEAFTPCLSVSLPSNRLISDLPVINCVMPFGRGDLSIIDGEIILKHKYSGVDVERKYRLTDDGLYIKTSLNSSTEFSVEGLIAWPFIWHMDCHIINNIKGVEVNNKNKKLSIEERQLGQTYKLLQPVSNPKGFAAKILTGHQKVVNDISYEYKVSIMFR